MDDDTVILEGGDRHGQPVKLSDMTHDGVSTYTLHDRHGAYRHDSETFADFVGDGQRVAVFEPAVTED